MLISDPLAAHPDPRGSHPALVRDGTTQSYEGFRADVAALARRLRGSGVVAGQVVGVSLGHSISHWSVLLALLRLGAVSVSLSHRLPEEIAALPQMSAVICAKGDGPVGSATPRRIELSPDWFGPLAGPSTGLPPVEEAARTAGRICFTSGTAGAPKAILLDSVVLQRRLAGTARRSLLDGRSILWCGLGPDSAYGFTATLAAWLCGGTVVFATGIETCCEQVVRSGVNVVIASPAMLNAVLKSCPAGDAWRINGPVVAAGGPLPASMRDALLSRFCRDVFIAYGSSEAGGVTLADARILDEGEGMVGAAFPDVVLEVVDENGTSIGPGEVGRVRVRTDSCVMSYLNDPAATARHFSGGWFYPGDSGRITPSGALVLARRPEDVLNVGGRKISATSIEAVLRDQPGIRDVAAVVAADPNGVSRLLVAAAGDATAMLGLPAALRAALPRLPPFHIVPVSRIPRGAMGKLSREDLARRIVERLEQPACGEAGDDFQLLRKPATP